MEVRWHEFENRLMTWEAFSDFVRIELTPLKDFLGVLCSRGVRIGRKLSWRGGSDSPLIRGKSWILTGFLIRHPKGPVSRKTKSKKSGPVHWLRFELSCGRVCVRIWRCTNIQNANCLFPWSSFFSKTQIVRTYFRISLITSSSSPSSSSLSWYQGA